MGEHKYRFNPDTLNFERIRISGWRKVKRVTLALAPGLLFGVIGIFLAFQFIDSPKEATLRRENQQLMVEYELINRQLADMENVLSDIERRDDNVYRVIFEADPIPSNVRMAGIGGVNRYRDLEGFANSELVIGTRKRLDKIAKRMYVQSLSLDEVGSLVLRKQEMLASIPSVEPIPQDRTRLSSGFGERMHPIYKIEKPHLGLDFTSPIGTPIHATGDGTVEFAGYNTTGYGIHVILDHGFGYQTLYGHMSEVEVRKGQKVKRGDVIGEVGSTGLSTGPHLHYEVHKDGVPMDPVNFLFNSLTPEEYARMVEIAGNAGQSMD
ncbi:MAG: M23 family metallopeptidase [Flavobacteriales bacterium]|jgi:murein DD-endopeptidase MepM/ murein hydrolase activator NlpD|nr:M23 family metallopeptidase [Flavobacteriales bacterium]MCB0759554.1 M23 family metallopeptidase [Flavobacteriales bacterium]